MRKVSFKAKKMNKKIILSLAILYSVITFGQNYRFDYRLDYKVNKEDELKKSELFHLIISENESKFISQNKLRIDSLREKAKADKSYAMKILSDLNQIPKTNFSFIIYSNKSSDTLKIIDKILSDKYVYRDNVNLNWKILNDTLTINNYKCIKATTDFRGRKYTAWFSTEIPISFGPYKFNGLPGLIIKINDNNNNYNFELIKILKLNSNLVLNDYNKSKLIQTNMIEFKKIQKKAAKNYHNTLEQRGIHLNEKGKKLFKNKISLKLNNPIELNENDE